VPFAGGRNARKASGDCNRQHSHGKQDESIFHLIHGNLRASQLDFAPLSVAHKRKGLDVVQMNPQDADRLHVADGATVRVWNPRGRCLASMVMSGFGQCCAALRS
jgi:anaerobic selenocysteine-containing dehydrogenase